MLINQHFIGSESKVGAAVVKASKTPAEVFAQATKVYQNQTALNKQAAGLRSDTDVGIIDPNKLNQAGVGIKNATVKTQTNINPTLEDKTSTFNDGVPIWEEKGMTREEYIAQNSKNIQGEFDVKTKEGEVFDPYAALQARQLDGTDGAVSDAIAKGKADAIRNKIMEGVGEQPKATDTTGMTKEEADAAKISDAQRLADWWRKVGEKSQMELGDASAGIADVKNEISTYKESIDKMLANLNSVDPAAGTAIGDIITNYTNNGGTQITPEALAKIQQLGSQGLSPAELKVKVNAILNTPSQTQLNGAGITDTGDSFTMSNGVTFRKGADGLPDYTNEKLPKDANAYDIALMELAVNNKIADTGLTQQIRLLKDLSEQVKRATITAKLDVENTFDTASNKVDEVKLKAMNDIKYQERKLSLEKDISLDNILTNEAQMEGYLKGQMEAWGAEGSSAALTVMATTKNNFLKQYTQTALGYDIELSRVADLQTEASMAFTNRTIEIANAKALGLQQINDDLLTNIDNIFNKTSEAYENTDLKLMQNNLNYGKQVQSIKQAEQEAAAAAAEATKKFNFDLMKEYADQTGYVYKIDKDGNVVPALDANGFPIPTFDREKSSAKNVNVQFGSDVNNNGSGGGGSGANSLSSTVEYLNGANPNWIGSTGNGNVVGGSPWTYGLDIDGKIGDPITSPVEGVVDRVVSNQNGSTKGFGNNVTVRVKNPDGTESCIQFSHLDSTNVQVGQQIKAGDLLGAMGNTGFVIAGEGGDGSHVDVTMWDKCEDAKDKEAAIAAEAAKSGSSGATPTGTNNQPYPKPIVTNSTKQADIDLANNANLILQGMIDGKTYEELVDENVIGNTEANKKAKRIAEDEFRKQGLRISYDGVQHIIDTMIGKEDKTMQERWDTLTSKDEKLTAKGDFVAALENVGIPHDLAFNIINERFPDPDSYYAEIQAIYDDLDAEGVVDKRKNKNPYDWVTGGSGKDYNPKDLNKQYPSQGGAASDLNKQYPAL